MRCLPLPVFALALVSSGGSAFAQSVTWLAPEAASVRAGSELGLFVETERSGARRRAVWAEVELDWLFVRGAGTQRNFDSIEAPEAGGPVRIALSQAGTTVIGLDREPRVERVSGDELLAFLSGKSNEAHLSAGWRGRVGANERRVRRVESAKLLLRVAGAEEAARPSSTASSKSGQPCEIRPLVDPSAIRTKSDLPLRVYLPGGSEAVRVVAHHLPTGRSLSFLTDASGVAHFTVDAAGAWAIEAHRAIELQGDPDADWEVRSATLRFDAALETREGGR